MKRYEHLIVFGREDLMPGYERYPLEDIRLTHLRTVGVSTPFFEERGANAIIFVDRDGDEFTYLLKTSMAKKNLINETFKLHNPAPLSDLQDYVLETVL